MTQTPSSSESVAPMPTSELRIAISNSSSDCWEKKVECGSYWLE